MPEKEHDYVTLLCSTAVCCVVMHHTAILSIMPHYCVSHLVLCIYIMLQAWHDIQCATNWIPWFSYSYLKLMFIPMHVRYKCHHLYDWPYYPVNFKGPSIRLKTSLIRPHVESWSYQGILSKLLKMSLLLSLSCNRKVIAQNFKYRSIYLITNVNLSQDVAFSKWAITIMIFFYTAPVY